MVSISILVGVVVAAVANAQTIETSSASSVAAATTVSQVMPPMATQSFDPASVNETITCEFLPTSSICQHCSYAT